MANKVDNVVDAIETKLKELVSADGTGVLRAVKRGCINPFMEHNPPVLGLAISDLERDGNTWTAVVLVMLAANKGGVAADRRVTEMVGEIDAKIAELVDAGTAGGGIDRPSWPFWYEAENYDDPLQNVGARAKLRIRVEDPLKV